MPLSYFVRASDNRLLHDPEYAEKVLNLLGVQTLIGVDAIAAHYVLVHGGSGPAVTGRCESSSR
jgi:hypothetical protein